jgi:hypothetical protein
VRVEVGAGESPTNWSLLGERSAPAQNEVLALWKPPPGARGDWSLRLRVRDAAGDEAESLLPVTLPLLLPLNPATITPATPAVAIAAVPAATNPTSTSGNAKSPNPGSARHTARPLSGAHHDHAACDFAHSGARHGRRFGADSAAARAAAAAGDPGRSAALAR